MDQCIVACYEAWNLQTADSFLMEFFFALDIAKMQVSQVYQTIKITNLTDMVTFSDFTAVEKLIVEAVKYNFVQMKVDHLKGVVSFGGQVNIKS